MPRFPLKLFLKDKWMLAPLVVSGLFNLSTWLYLGLAIKPRPEAVFLHYTVHFGVDLSGPWSQIFFLPLLGLILILINFIVAYFIYDQNKNLSRLIAIATVALEVFLFTEAIFLAFLNA